MFAQPKKHAYPTGNDYLCARFLWIGFAVGILVWVGNEAAQLLQGGGDIAVDEDVRPDAVLPYLDLCEDKLGKGWDTSVLAPVIVVNSSFRTEATIKLFINGDDTTKPMTRELISFGKDAAGDARVARVMREAVAGSGQERFQCWRFRPSDEHVTMMHSLTTDDRLVANYDVYLGKNIAQTRLKGWTENGIKLTYLTGFSARFSAAEIPSRAMSLEKEKLFGILVGLGCRRSFRIGGAEKHYRWFNSYGIVADADKDKETWTFETASRDKKLGWTCDELKTKRDVYDYKLHFRLELPTSVSHVTYRRNYVMRFCLAISACVGMLWVFQCLEMCFPVVSDRAVEPRTFFHPMPLLGLGLHVEEAEEQPDGKSEEPASTPTTEHTPLLSR